MGIERRRDVVDDVPSEGYFKERLEDGWTVTAVEWERERDLPEESVPYREEVPYGLRVDTDCRHLVEDSDELRTLMIMLEQLISDKSLSETASLLNARGLSTRAGEPWSQLDIFRLFPRLIEVAPRLYPSADWNEIRQNLRLVG